MKPAAPVPHLTHPRLLRKPRSWRGRLIESATSMLMVPILLVAGLAALVAAMSTSVGVHVTTSARSGTGDPLRAIGSRYLVAIVAEKGDTTNPVLCRNMGDVVAEFGNWVNYGFGSDDLTSYFEEGGTEAWVIRVVGPAATKGVAQLVDRAGGGAVNTLLLTAFSAGGWSANLTRQIADGTVANTFTVTLAYKAGTADEIVETYRDLASPADAVTKINGRSRLAVASNSGSATAAPNNNPAVQAATAFTAGADDRGSILAAHMVAGLAKFTNRCGPGAVAIPGYDLSLIGAGLIAHCKANGFRIGLVHDVVGDTVAGHKTLAGTVYGTADSEWIALCGGWVKIPDGAGGYRLVPPTGAVAGRRAAAHQTEGPWRWPSGEAGLFSYITGTELDIDLATAGSMIVAGVNPIRVVGDNATELYGWRSLSNQPAYYSIAARDTLNVIAWLVDQQLEQFYDKPIDSKGNTVAGVRETTKAILEQMRIAGGLFERLDPSSGAQLDPGYSVTVVADSVARTITVTVGVRIVEAAELINVTITKVASDQAV